MLIYKYLYWIRIRLEKTIKEANFFVEVFHIKIMLTPQVAAQLCTELLFVKIN